MKTKLLTLAVLSIALVACESPTAVVPPSVGGKVAAFEGLQCARYLASPSLVDSVGQFDKCADGLPAEIVVVRWTPVVRGQCQASPTGEGIRGGLQAVEYVYGCSHARQVPPPPVQCADCDW